MSETYTASDLHVLTGLAPVRKRPGMYIGSTGSRGLHHMLWEIVDNAMDEVANGFGNKILVTIPILISVYPLLSFAAYIQQE